MKKPLQKTNIGAMLALLLLGVFAVCILSVLLMGADAYQQMVRRDMESYNRRTAVQYISTRIHQGDSLGGISVRVVDGKDVLVLSETIDGATYETCVYCCDGYLRELFTAAGGFSAPENGEKIIEAQDFKAELEAGRLSVRVLLSNGRWDTMVYHLRSGEGAAA